MAGSNQMHHPHRGGMQFWPRKRAARVLAKVRNWSKHKEAKLSGFIAYKAGMTHAFVMDKNSNSPTKNLEVSRAVTIVECPPIKVMGARFYKHTTDGLKLAGEIFSTKVDKELIRKTGIGTNNEVPADFDEVRVVAYSQPKMTGIGKKTPDVTEIGIGGEDKNAKADYAKSLLDKEIKASDLFKEGQLVDIHAVSKGKGFQGTVKRYGVKRRQHKSEKTVRGVGTLGSWHPNRVLYTVAQPGKMGFHQRTEYNELIYKIGTKPEEVNQDGGITRYGFVKNDFILIKGSVIGVKKRALIISQPMRPWQKYKQTQPEITYISKASKQGMR
jgi:large subunit ribosomal protein L3